MTAKSTRTQKGLKSRATTRKIQGKRARTLLVELQALKQSDVSANDLQTIQTAFEHLMARAVQRGLTRGTLHKTNDGHIVSRGTP